MDFARLDAAVPLQAFAAVNLAALSREVVAGYAVRAENQDVDLGVDAPGVVQAFGAEAELRSAHREPGRQRAALCALRGAR